MEFQWLDSSSKIPYNFLKINGKKEEVTGMIPNTTTHTLNNRYYFSFFR
ncbi:hypothetical protein STRPO_1536 [Streptococcus porcinus str. Jelinkova 176]|uniref:Uncharacterized protein n=1 Tax=Streptococcus porcinus str. Jelinkova 176 TaxID=873448 RepID=A0ABN0CXD4_STRPO|nr:hypothetical protein STRPO_1536 [Streptococcus porcinus str. Jelinkova 176]